MNHALYVNFIFDLEKKLSELNAICDIQSSIARFDVDRYQMTMTRLDIRKLLDQTRLLVYVDPSDLPDTIAMRQGEVDKTLIQAFEKLRATELESVAVEDVREILRRIDANIFEVVHSMEIVGKWPPDKAPC